MSNGRQVQGQPGLPFVGTGAEGLGEAFSDLGQNIAGLIDPEKQMRDVILDAALSNPDLLQQFAEAQRSLESEEGEEANALAAFGFKDSKFAKFLSNLSPETAEELARRKGLTPEMVDLLVEVKRQDLETKLAAGEAGEAVAVEEEAGALARVELGIPQIAAQALAAQGQAEEAKAALTSRSIAEYDTYMQGLSVEEQGAASLAIVNPVYLGELLARDRMDLDTRIANRTARIQERRNEIAVASSLAEAETARVKLQFDVASQAAELMSEAFNKDNSKDERKARLLQFNMLQGQIERISPNMAVSFRLQWHDKWYAAFGIDVVPIQRLAGLIGITEELEVVLKQAAAIFATSETTPDQFWKTETGANAIQQLAEALPGGEAEAKARLGTMFAEVKRASLDLPQQVTAPLYLEGGKLNPEFNKQLEAAGGGVANLPDEVQELIRRAFAGNREAKAALKRLRAAGAIPKATPIDDVRRIAEFLWKSSNFPSIIAWLNGSPFGEATTSELVNIALENAP